MTLIKWGPQPRFADFVDSMLDKDFDFNRTKSCGCLPKTNILENDNGFVLEIAVPGMKKADFNVNLEKDLLTVSAEIEETKENDTTNYTRREFTTGSFKRTFTVPKTIEEDKIKADYKNGILTISLPKMEEVKVSKEIKIS